MTHRRIYAVQYRGNRTTHLVEAVSRAQALRHVAELAYDVSLPTPKQVLDMAGVGIGLEQAGAAEEAA